MADLLRWIGIVMLASFVVTVLASVLPLRLGDAQWLDGVLAALRGGGGLPLIGVGLILLAAHLRDRTNESFAVSSLRRLCIWVALAYLLLIPLQVWSGQRLIKHKVDLAGVDFYPVFQSLQSLYATKSVDELRAVIQAIPGASENPLNRLSDRRDVVNKIRDRLISELEPQVRRRQSEFDLRSRDLWTNGLMAMFKDGLLALFSAIGFASIARSKPYRPTLLQSLLGARRPSKASTNEFERLARDYQDEEESR
ncbi:MAG: hypothetical protein ACO3B3_02745 [Cyanobium sp.]|jgi:hypothetical protein